MNKKVVLVVDEDSHRAEKLLFIVRLGGYKTVIVSADNDAEACPEKFLARRGPR